jgi:aspartyl-tRNA(Asn)/glutamyl-tRNA(Gln) amidotransferase subunit C
MLAFGMPAFTPADVAAIAALAHLDLDAAEAALYARQLAQILAYAEAIQNVDTTAVSPTAHASAPRPVDRPDETRACLDRRDALANAPDAAVEAGFFKVPRVIDTKG